MKIRHALPLVVGSLLLAVALSLAVWRQDRPAWSAYQSDPQIRTLVPSISQKPELCLTCHYGIEEISKSHPVDIFGCVSCHGGDALSLDPAAVHKSLIGPRGNPADPSVVSQTCGSSQCHGGDLASNRNHIVRTQLSLHSTYAGAINAVLKSQGVDSPLYGAHEIRASDYGPAGVVDFLAAFDPAKFSQPAVKQFAADCLGCHTSAPAASAPHYFRGTGCAACHTPYNAQGLYAGGDPSISKAEPGRPARHTLTVLMPYTQCTTCHARGAYSLQSMTFTPNGSGQASERSGNYQPHSSTSLSVKCEKELDCIDCHNASETMGDGHLYPNMAASPLVQCQTCHGTLTSPPALTTLTDPNNPAFRRDNLNDNYSLSLGDQVVQSPNGDVLGAVRWQDNRLVLTSRLTGQTFLVPLVQGSACKQNPKQQEARYCRECHAAK